MLGAGGGGGAGGSARLWLRVGATPPLILKARRKQSEVCGRVELAAGIQTQLDEDACTADVSASITSRVLENSSRCCSGGVSSVASRFKPAPFVGGGLRSPTRADSMQIEGIGLVEEAVL